MSVPVKSVLFLTLYNNVAGRIHDFLIMLQMHHTG